MGAHPVLMRCALDVRDPTVLAFVGFFSAAFDRDGARSPMAGALDARDTRRVLDRWFPGAAAALGAQTQTQAIAAPPWPSRSPRCADEFDDLVALFAEHANPDAGVPDDARCVARLLAAACAGDNHLWQDLRLPSRRELSALISHWFPRLAAKNTHDMKWKKFFYKQLCAREGLFVCKAPSCGACSDYAHCFGPE